MTKFMLLQRYEPAEACDVPMTDWEPGDIRAHIDFQLLVNQELVDSGEWVGGEGLAGPDLAKFVVSDGTGAPVVTDGPYAEAKELLAGYRIVDVESPERAIEIAARVSAAPGPGGVPIRQRIEVRQIMARPPADL